MGRVNRCSNWTATKWPKRYSVAWQAANKEGNVFAVGGRAASLAPRTRWNNEMSFGRYLEFHFREGKSYGPVMSLRSLRAFSANLSQSVSPYTVLSILTQAVSAYRAMYPDADLSDLHAALARFATQVRPSREIESRLCSPLELLAIGNSLMSQAEANQVQGNRTASQFRTGALIVAAALCPLRHGNWQKMIIGRHVDLETGRVGFKADEMKRKKRMEFVLPPEVLQPLRRYADHYRPMLIKSGSLDEGYLWPSPTGGKPHRNTLGMAVGTAVQKATGKAFHFHLFRHSCATFISEVSPERTRMAAGTLHHATPRTTNKHYIKGLKRKSFRNYQKAVLALAQKARSKIAKRKRG